MEWHRLVASFLAFVAALAALLLAAMATADEWVRRVLTALGVGYPVQTIILILVAVLVLLAALRLMGGLVRVLIVVLIVLFAIHLLLPTLRV